tara:strand:+ start:2233 stop:2505 length:273 start_codon:yes stop_codon:yes gene_type:complete
LRRNNWNNNRPRRNYDNNNSQGGLTVEVRNGDFMGALRRFKKKVAEDGIIQEYKERQFFEKPSEKRKKAKAAGRARWLKKRAKQQQDQGW